MKFPYGFHPRFIICDRAYCIVNRKNESSPRGCRGSEVGANDACETPQTQRESESGHKTVASAKGGAALTKTRDGVWVSVAAWQHPQERKNQPPTVTDATSKAG